MSWLARSLANSLKLENEKDEEEEEEEEEEERNQREGTETPGRGVKEDLSELTKTFTRQLWGVASFLAPPPSSDPEYSSSSTSKPQISQLEPSIASRNLGSPTLKDEDPSDSPRFSGIRNDFAEIGGRFKTGISKLSNHKAVSEISKLASSFLPYGSEEEIDSDWSVRSVGDAVGITDEVLTFARNISMHPETWLDFPLFLDDEDTDDFEMSDAQQEHALAVEHLSPRLAALRIELCPGHMSEGCFWKIYFVLLHSRLTKHDAELLSTPQIVKARGMLMQLQELPNHKKSDGRCTPYTKEMSNSVPHEQLFTSSFETPSITTSLESSALKPINSVAVADLETEKYPVVTNEMKLIDKPVVEDSIFQIRNRDFSGISSKEGDPKYEEDGDDWLEDNTEMGPSGSATIHLGNEEDVSFSDLEEEDDSKPTGDFSTKTRGWVQLSKSSNYMTRDVHPTGSKHLPRSSDSKESNDWLNVDEIDVV